MSVCTDSLHIQTDEPWKEVIIFAQKVHLLGHSDSFPSSRQKLKDTAKQSSSRKVMHASLHGTNSELWAAYDLYKFLINC